MARLRSFKPVVAALISAAACSLAAPDTGEKAPTLVLKDVQGKQFSLQSAVAKGPVFVSFWGTWCPPCREEFPLISQMAKKWQPKGVRVISIALRDREPAVREFLKKHRAYQTVALDNKDALLKSWDLSAVPVSFLVGRGGKVVGFYDQFDKSDLPAIEKEIAAALAAYRIRR